MDGVCGFENIFCFLLIIDIYYVLVVELSIIYMIFFNFDIFLFGGNYCFYFVVEDVEVIYLCFWF